MPKDKLKAYVMLRQDLLDEKKELESRLNEINLVLEGTSARPLKVKRGRPIGKTKAKRAQHNGKMTTSKAILKALEGGQVNIKTISEKVGDLKGKVSTASINQALLKLKKDGKIANPARGQYALK